MEIPLARMERNMTGTDRHWVEGVQKRLYKTMWMNSNQNWRDSLLRDMTLDEATEMLA